MIGHCVKHMHSDVNEIWRTVTNHEQRMRQATVLLDVTLDHGCRRKRQPVR
jgi:hypothetical protein